MKSHKHCSKKRISSVFTVSFLLLFGVGISHAATYFVNFDAGTNGDGLTAATAWNRLQYARASQGPVRAGDVVYVWGTSMISGEAPKFTAADKGDATQKIRYVERPGYTAVIDATNHWDNRGISFNDDADYIVIDGFEIRNSDGQGITFTNATSLEVNGVEILNCDIHQHSGYGGVTTGSGEVAGLIVQGCNIYDNGSDNSHHGIYLSDCGGCMISENNIYNNSGNGIQLQSRIQDSHYINNCIIEKNGIHDNGWYDQNLAGHGIRFGEYGGNADHVTNCILKNNLIYNNARSGSYWERQNSGNKDYNNSYFGNKQGGINGQNFTSELQVKNNIAWSNGGTQIATGILTQSDNLATDPLWISTNPQSADFLHLSQNSPARNAGTDLSAQGVTDDYFGTSRPQDSAYDIGAHEYCSSGCTHPTSQPPVANAGSDITVTDTDDSKEEDITLDGSSSADSDGIITNYQWSRGGLQIGTGMSPVVNFGIGTHTVTLTVTDNNGLTDTDTVNITVEAASPANPPGTSTPTGGTAEGSGGGCFIHSLLISRPLPSE